MKVVSCLSPAEVLPSPPAGFEDRAQLRAGSGSRRSITRARSIHDRGGPSAAPQPGDLSPWPPQPSPGALGRIGHLQSAAELLHRAPAGGHRIAQQEHRDAPLLNQPPQHRILSLRGPATGRKGARSVSLGPPSPRTTPLPPFSLLSESVFNFKGISQVAKKKKNQQLSLESPGTYLFRNQLLQLCFFQTTQAKKGPKKGEEKKKKSEAPPPK